jgi:hypothetical protein
MVQNLNSLTWTLREKSPITDTVFCKELIDAFEDEVFSFFLPLFCLLFFDLRILITPLVSSNSSYTKQIIQQSILIVKVRREYE